MATTKKVNGVWHTGPDGGSIDPTILEGKMDKVAGATAGNIAILDSAGNVADSDKKPSDFADAADLANKADKDGYYRTLGAGYADNLAGRLENTEVEFTRQRTASTKDIAGKKASIDRIKGKTLVWNQIYQRGPNISGVVWQGGKCTINRTFATTANYYDNTSSGAIYGSFIVGHKYYIRLFHSSGITGSGSIILNGFSSAGTGLTLNNKESSYRNILVKKTTAYPTVWTFNAGAICENFVVALEFIDLTQMFGAGNEPSTVAEFEALFPEDYYPYNAGQLLSFTGTGIKTDGFNQYDGTKARVLGGEAYYIKGTYTTLKFAKTIDGEQTDITPTDNIFTPTEDGYIFATGVGEEFCINFSNPTRNGEYEPYWSADKALDLSNFGGSLKSVGNVYDEWTKTKDIKRIGERAHQEGDEDDPSVITDGTTTQYVLATPVETDIIGRNADYDVDDMGTETITPEGVDASGVPYTAPMVAEITYGLNAVDTLRNLPKNYQSQESMDALLNALGTALGFTWSKTFTGGRYNYTITPNTPEE